MGRRKYSDKELEEIGKLRYENKKLKKQISSLRKQLQRVDIDRYENLKDLLDKQAEEDYQDVLKEQMKGLQDKWECHQCHEGFLKLYILQRRDGIFYYRKCTDCANRTVTKPYNKDVKGATEDVE